MARLNLTIPDSLYERLERLRDRVNVSKVCAVALAKELEMLEGTTTAAGDAKVSRMVQRLGRWYPRGRQDGEEWAIERATVDELSKMEEDWDEDTARDMDDLDDIDEDDFPTLNVREQLQRWIIKDKEEGVHEPMGADWRAYLRGWYHGARDLWEQAKPSLDYR
ncbi:MAG TPA: hypothetical protein VKT32_13870 [Chthonomonadaceae bacterium]|nr:hypothetical protein [Chthonomonadaceae bacterium]